MLLLQQIKTTSIKVKLRSKLFKKTNREVLKGYLVFRD
jgi:hypothetical protein